MSRLSLVLAALAATGVSSAQGFQCTLVGTFDNHGPYNDIWGYVAPNGDEYALLGATTGLVVVDCSNPAAPVERGWLPWHDSTWRDIRTYGHYAYVSVDEDMAGGFMIVDLSNPNAPVSLGIFGGAQFDSAHNVCVDVAAGRLYFAGADTGTAVYDLTGNPANPTFLGFATGPGQSNYYHDLQVENGYGYGSMVHNGVLRIFDASTWPPTTLSESATPSEFTHNAWANAAGTLCVTTDERSGGLVRFFDVTNKSAPVALGQLSPSPNAIPHNAFLIDDVCHVAWYREGYQCIDVSDPTTPIVVASYDTKPTEVTGFGGAWGCYPFQPSGNVYLSDISDGLFILRPHLTDLAIAHTPPADGADDLGPYPIVATVTSSHALAGVTLTWSIDGGAPQSAAMLPTGQPDEYRFDLPGMTAPARVEYHIDAADSEAPRRSPRRGEHRFVVGTEVTRWSDDFEVALGWTHGGNNDEWQRGVSAGKAASSGSNGWSDPVRATSGSRMWGTDLGIFGGNGSYPGNSNNWLQSPAIPTGGLSGLRLGYRRHLSLGVGDQARVLVNGVTVWSTSSVTKDVFWQTLEHDVSPWTNGQTQVVVRFELQSNGSGSGGGWSLDDVRLFTRHDCTAGTAYGAGTPGTGNVVPTLALVGAPVFGGTPSIVGAQMLPNSLAVLAVSLQAAAGPALGVDVLVDPFQALLVTAPIDGAGQAQWPLQLPASPATDGVFLFHQAVALDPGSPGMFLSASHGLRVCICSSAP